VSPAAQLRQAYERLVRERGLVADPAQRAIVDRLADLAERLAANPPAGPLRRAVARRFPRSLPLGAPRGLYLWGGVGRGKTWLMDLFHNHVGIEARSRSHFHHFMRDVHGALAGLDRRANPLDLVARQIAAGSRLVCLDELVVSDIGDAMILHGLLAGLLREGVTLVITSNLPPAGLYQGGLQRERFLPVIALLESRLDVVELAGSTDYRLRHLEHASTYVLTGAADAGARLQALFERLANDGDGAAPVGHTPAGDAMIVEDRPIPLLRAASGMAWFDFAALCEGPRSQLDYIEIARELHTVFVTGVPVMDELHDDAARRFIALVDEFYDCNVKLVVGAAAEPTRLYRGERLKFAFERTISRLIEMRSREYLAREHRATS
jgi:cell division protein ZapE